MRNPVWFMGVIFSMACPALAGDDSAMTRALGAVDMGPIELVEARAEAGLLQVVLGPEAENLRGRDQVREDLVRDLLWAAREIDPALSGVTVWVETANGVRVPLAELLHDESEVELVRRLRRQRPRVPRNLPPGDLPYGGSLTGRTIALSPGHGLTWYDGLGDWSFQRSLINMPGCESCMGIIEDLSNNQIAIRYLIPHLLRAGATVWSVRERDFSDFESVVDDGDQGVVEQGPWADGSSPGGFEDDYRVLLASEGGQVRYPLETEVEGIYWVSAWYVAGGNRVSDAVFRVHHLGGSADLHLDQTRDGSRWIHLGAFRFAPGAECRVEILPGPEAEPDRYLVADAVRIGGGIDRTEMAGKPADGVRWQMSARFNLPYFGLPDEVHTGSDVTVRPAWAEWQGADAYLSLHSNASGGSTSSASGTSTYRYSCRSFPDHSSAPDPAECDDPPGSDRLQRKVHEAMIEFLRAEWDPEWRDRGRLVADFGEMRVLDSIPGALVESAFHDGTEKASPELRAPDNLALQDPRFRYWLGYAMYAGLARYFDDGVRLLPARAPGGLFAVNEPDGGLLVGWEPVDDADGYRVRWAVDGLGMGAGLHTGDTSVVLGGLNPGQTVAVRVSALNSGGEGPPSEWMEARYRGSGCFADVLLVAGFDRQDAYVGDGRNRRDQAVAHAEAIAAIPDRNVYFDCASNEAVVTGRVGLRDYAAVVWILGEESSADETFDTDEQAAIKAYLQAEGAWMASGAEIGWDLVERGSADDQLFFADAFDAIYLADDADTFGAAGAGPFAEVGAMTFDDGSRGIYPVEWPDVIEAQGDTAEVVLEYDTGEGAAVASEASPGRSVLVGFPFETIVEPEARRALMDAVLRFLMPGHTPDDYDADGLPDAWEHEHGTDPLTPSADDDPDGDGRTNLQEYQDGTDPQVSDLDPVAGGCGCGDPGAHRTPWLLLALGAGARRIRKGKLLS